MYRKFADKIACVDGEYYDIGEVTLQPMQNTVGPELPELGEARYAIGKVTQMLGENEAIIYHRGGSWGDEGDKDFFFHVRNLHEADKPVRRMQTLNETVIHCGVFHWTDREGRERALASYELPGELTRDEFREAIEQGMELVEYAWEYYKVPAPAGRATADGKNIPLPTATIQKRKFVSSPID